MAGESLKDLLWYDWLFMNVNNSFHKVTCSLRIAVIVAKLDPLLLKPLLLNTALLLHCLHSCGIWSRGCFLLVLVKFVNISHRGVRSQPCFSDGPVMMKATPLLHTLLKDPFTGLYCLLKYNCNTLCFGQVWKNEAAASCSSHSSCSSWSSLWQSEVTCPE